MNFNPHPPLAMFPAVLAIALLVLELLSFRGLAPAKLRALLLTVFVIAVITTYYSGFYGVDFAAKVSPEVIKAHQGYGRFILLLCCPLLIVGILSALLEGASPWVRRAYWALLGGIVACTLYTSYLGGQVVFRHGGGVLGVGY